MMSQQIEGDHDEIEQFLQMIKYISDNHHRYLNFLEKINQIFRYYKNQIQQNLTDIEIFYIFENSKTILLFLLKDNIIAITESIYKMMMNKVESNGNRYCHFFYPEIENFIGEEKMEFIKNELLANDPNIFENFDEKRSKGENDSFICSLIREDSIDEFISYVNRNNYSLLSQIPPSIYETNTFLIENENTSLIEYSAFFGSIRIFQYLFNNNVKLTPSLWLYSIHSKNAELIQFLESNKVHPPILKKDLDNYLSCFIESIKCHHNDFADYIELNLLSQNQNDSQQQKKEIISNCIKYRNYSYFQAESIRD